MNIRVFRVKLECLESIFNNSVAESKKQDQSYKYNAELDEKQGARLSELIRSYDTENDREFAEAPWRIKTLEEAEQMSKLMSKISELRLEHYDGSLNESDDQMFIAMESGEFNIPMHTEEPTWRKVYIDWDKKFYSGFMCAKTAHFHSDDAVKYKLMMKCIDNLENLDLSRSMEQKQ